jgi:hypothetical protein
MIEVGLLLALGCALLSNVSLLCKHRGACRAPDVSFRRPLRSGAALFASRWWTIGFLVATLAWFLHLGALALAPLSLVQAVIAGGLVLLVLPARRWFGIRVGRRELIGLGLAASGLAFLGFTATQPPDGVGVQYSAQTMAVFEGAAISAGLILLLSGSHGRAHPHGGLLLAVSAGLLLGVANVALKALVETVPGDLVAILSPWTLIAAVAAVGAFFALARSLQLGEPVQVVVVTSVAVNCAAIVGGILVFGDPMGSDAFAVVGRSLAFAALVAAAALIPAAPRSAPRAQPA